MRTLTDPFASSGRGRFRLHLGFNPDGAGTNLASVPPDAHRGVLDLMVWDARQVRIDVRLIDPHVVSAAIGCLLVRALAESGGLLLHAAMLVRAGAGFLFAGRSGAGKSTLAANATGVACVHDDKSVVRCRGGRWWAYGVPMKTSAGATGKNISAPLECIYVVKKSVELSKLSLGSAEALAEIGQHVMVPVDEVATLENLYKSMLSLVAGVGFGTLRFRKDSDVSTIL